MTDPTNPRLLKIQALLNKAEGTDNESERDAYMAKANELLVKWGIDDAMLASANASSTDQVVTVTVKLEGIYQSAWLRLASYTASAVRVVKTFKRSYKHYVEVTFVGYASDVARVELLFTSLQVQAARALGTWWSADISLQFHWSGRKLTAQERYVERRAFLLGFSDAAHDKLALRHREAVTETGPGTELAIVDRASLVQQWMNEKFNLTTGRRTSLRTGVSFYDGAAAGRNADVGDKRVGPVRPAIGG